MASLPNLPSGGLIVLFVCVFGLILVVIFVVKEFLFSFHRRRGIEFFNEGRYHTALQHLIQAERLWILRSSKQTMQSRAEDYKNLGMVLDLIGETAGHCSLKIDASEYRKAISEMERFFSNNRRSFRDYPKIYLTFTRLQKQFRAEIKRIRA